MQFAPVMVSNGKEILDEGSDSMARKSLEGYQGPILEPDPGRSQGFPAQTAAPMTQIRITLAETYSRRLSQPPPYPGGV